VEANTTRTNALKRKNENLEVEVEQYRELYRSIRERPECEAAELFRRIRVTEEPLDVFKQLTAANLLIGALRRVSSQPSEDTPDESTSDFYEENKSNGKTPQKIH
jgi:hypothetical protein